MSNTYSYPAQRQIELMNALSHRPSNEARVTRPLVRSVPNSRFTRIEGLFALVLDLLRGSDCFEGAREKRVTRITWTSMILEFAGGEVTPPQTGGYRRACACASAWRSAFFRCHAGVAASVSRLHCAASGVLLLGRNNACHAYQRDRGVEPEPERRAAC